MKDRMQPLQLTFPAAGPRWRHAVQHLAGRNEGGLRVLACAFLVISVGLLLATGWQVLHLRRAAEAARTANTAQAQRSGPHWPAATPAASAPGRAQRSDWNLAARALSTPWPAWLDALERQTSDDVALVSLEAHPTQGRIRLMAEARTLEALLAYTATLHGVQAFEDVVLLRHETRERDTIRPVRATLDVVLTPSPAKGTP